VCLYQNIYLLKEQPYSIIRILSSNQIFNEFALDTKVHPIHLGGHNCKGDIETSKKGLLQEILVLEQQIISIKCISFTINLFSNIHFLYLDFFVLFIKN